MICLFSQKRKLRLRESEFDSSVAAEGGIPAESFCPDDPGVSALALEQGGREVKDWTTEFPLIPSFLP